MPEGFELFSVCLSERQMARITSALARSSRGNPASEENDTTIFEMFRHAKPLHDGGPPKIKFYRCVSTTAQGLMRACLDAIDDDAKEGTLSPDRFEFFRNVFDAAQKYWLSDVAMAISSRVTR